MIELAAAIEAALADVAAHLEHQQVDSAEVDSVVELPVVLADLPVALAGLQVDSAVGLQALPAAPAVGLVQ